MPTSQRNASIKREPSTYNSVDEVIDEANAFLQCAHEAQATGRLMEAHTYLVLAHGRLIGLGRFAEYGDSFGNNNGLESDQDNDSAAMQKSVQTPGVSLPQKTKITPSPTNTNQSQAASQDDTNTLSGNLAQWSQELLYAVKGTDNSYATQKKRKNKRKRRAASFDDTDSTVESAKVCYETKIQCKHHSHERCHANYYSASVMTQESACIDAKALMKKFPSLF